MYFGDLGRKKGWGAGGGGGGGCGGLPPKRKVAEPTHFVLESFWVDHSIWPSFIQIGAWCSGGFSLKNHLKDIFKSCFFEIQ